MIYPPHLDELKIAQNTVTRFQPWATLSEETKSAMAEFLCCWASTTDLDQVSVSHRGEEGVTSQAADDALAREVAFNTITKLNKIAKETLHNEEQTTVLAFLARIDPAKDLGHI